MSIITNFAIGQAFYHLVDDGCANLLQVETLRHGTSPTSYVKIRWQGAEPNKNADTIGSTPAGLLPVEGYFYVFKETLPFLKAIKRSKLHALFATIHVFSDAFIKTKLGRCLSSRREMCAVRAMAMALGLSSTAIGALTPVLSFRFLKKEISTSRFEDDPNYRDPSNSSGASDAYRTKSPIEPWRIGFLGTIFTGINRELFQRVKSNPSRSLKGAVQLAGAAAIAWCASNLSSISFLAGVALG